MLDCAVGEIAEEEELRAEEEERDEVSVEDVLGRLRQRVS